MKFAHICDGCKKLIEYDVLPQSLPSGWFISPRDWSRLHTTIIACSADCVAAAKRRHEREEWDVLGKRLRAIADIKLERVP